MTKKVCFVCCEGKGFFRFLEYDKTLKEWMESLSIRDNPPDHAQSCAGHFLSHEQEIKLYMWGTLLIELCTHSLTYLVYSIFGENVRDLVNFPLHVLTYSLAYWHNLA